MYPVAVVGDNATARAAITACRQSGFEDITWVADADPSPPLAAETIPANITKVVTAMGGNDALEELGHQPDRQQVRLATSGFLLSELPLGHFSRERYGAPHINIEHGDWAQVLPVADLEAESSAELSDLERQYPAVLLCTAHYSPANAEAMASHNLWHAKLPVNAASSRANITWIGRQQCAWQFSTRTSLHVYFSLPLARELAAEDWHPLLHTAIEAAQLLREFNAHSTAVREHWHAGAAVYLGDACSGS